jgi:type III secretion system YscQ/HrcQ family protein
LPRLSRRQVRLDGWLSRFSSGLWSSPALSWLAEALGTDLAVERAEVLWRASGLRRVGVVAQFTLPRLATRVALGLETPLAHALVDRLLGFDRWEPEGRLQVTPVEWGLLTFLVGQSLARQAQSSEPLGLWDLIIDRVGPDPFDTTGLGSVVTIRWPVRVGAVSGSMRLWLAESLVALWLVAGPRPVAATAALQSPRRIASLAGCWRAEAGQVDLPRGLASLRVGGVWPLRGSPLRGSPQSPSGHVELALSGLDGRFWLLGDPVPLSAGGRLTVITPLQHEPISREPMTMSPAHDPHPQSSDPGAPSPTDVPLTLVVELGRVSLTVGRLADLKPGDVLELGRHSREPVELTSGDRLVARGELVQIDTELGVRIISVFL